VARETLSVGALTFFNTQAGLTRLCRIHEFNVDQILDAFLPYHGTPNFIKMLAILHLEYARSKSTFVTTIPDALILSSQSSPWSFLLVAKNALTPLYIHDLVTEMAANQRLTRIVISVLQRHVQANAVHRAVIGFHMSVTADYLRRIKLDDVQLAFILPSLIEGVTKTRNKDCTVRHDL
jgi:U3 small nucleolar RNA-associated protein 10